jgi:EAL domain-containing protein (putative c-di-GMP-specific phosphodiesterase class I)/GGDEF domain-containing protein
LWAGVIAFVVFAALLFEPLDRFVWMVQTRLHTEELSGRFAFVAFEEELGNPAAPEQREKLARVVQRLNELDVERIVIDEPLHLPSDPAVDRRLGDVLRASEAPVILRAADDWDQEANAYFDRPIPSIGEGIPFMVSGHFVDYLGFAWTMTTTRSFSEVTLPTMATVLAGNMSRDDEFHINYSLSTRSITEFDANDFLRNDGRTGKREALSRKTVIIGNGRSTPSARASVPGQFEVPKSFIGILAAETLLRGPPVFIRGYWLLLPTIIGLVFVAAAGRGRPSFRQGGYVLISMALAVLFASLPALNIRAELSGAIVALALYGVFRLRTRWQERAALRDVETGLPRLRALENRIAEENDAGHVVVARIHGFEQVLKTLQKSDRSRYLRRIADRLRANDPNLDLYNDNHHFAWLTSEESPALLVDHLEGLRALFAAPVLLDDRPIDVGITFGVAPLVGDTNTIVPSALAASEEGSEASNPIVLANISEEKDLAWNISMRARIDAAMERGEIYCLYQPKIDAASGELCGVESLVRWEDPERGSVSPSVFIPQCEKAGRMEDLTRYVLQSTCSAGSLLHARGRYLSVSANVSATMLNNGRVVSIVREVLNASRFDPAYLVLEVTETARITNLDTACDILRQLKLLGLHISMDDFGVGAANFETFFRLPFDELKIDRLFVSNIVADDKARAIARSLISMGNEARVAVVAEGVETADELRLLMDLGCSQVQGYALSHPITLSKLLEFQQVSVTPVAR